MKKSWWVLRIGLALALSLGVWGALPVAQARPLASSTITGCPLDQAITTANQGSATGTCTLAGAGAPYTVTLSGDVSLTAALPSITSDIVINTDGTTRTIDQPSEDAASVFDVGSSGKLTLIKIRVIATGGNADGIDVAANGELTMVDSTLDGLIFGVESEGTLTVRNSTVANSALGIWAFGGSVTISNSTLSDNSGDGLDINAPASATISYSTIVGNSNGLDINDGSITISTTIVAQNQFSDCQVSSGSIASGDYNIEANASCGFTALHDQQHVTPLQLAMNSTLAANNSLNGTSTHALGATSAAVNQIPGGFPGCNLTPGDPNRSTDQRGGWRAGVGCDVGAFEYNAINPTAPNAITLSDFQASPSIEAGGTWLIAVLVLLGTSALFAVRRRTAR